MKIKEIYDLALKTGIENDLRSKLEIKEYLNRKKKVFEKLSKEEKLYFDQETLTNPYSDTRIHFAGGKKEIKRVLCGIDLSTGGVLLAKELGVDLIIIHHPIGDSLANLDSVMELQIDLLEKLGIPVNIAEKLTHKRISEVARGLNPVNHQITVDAARLLKINLMNVHTPADNCVFQFVTQEIEKKKPRYVGELLEILNEIPEYQEAKKHGAGPILFSGNEKNRAGKIAVSEMTGGTDGSKEIYEMMARAGIGTIISMHQSEEHREAAEKAHINVVIAGHISSDSIGMNLILDKLEEKGLEIIPFAGLIRVKRTKHKK